MNEFLNPKSMSTPGVAGALTMLLANSLCDIFPEFPFRYVALALSFAIGALAFAATTMKAWERGLYWVVNSLIIFSMGVGTSNIGANVAERRASIEHSASVASTLMSALTGTAFAQGNPTPPPGKDRAAAARAKAQEGKARERQAANQRAEAERSRFFKRW